jgi:hypothetical protein
VQPEAPGVDTVRLVAATFPEVSVLPRAVTHWFTTRAAAVAATVEVYAVAEPMMIFSVEGAPLRDVVDTVIAVAVTAVTLPDTGIVLTVLPEPVGAPLGAPLGRGPPVGAPVGGVPPFPPGPPPPNPVVQAPTVVVAVTAMVVAAVALVDAAFPENENTQDPTVTADAAAGVVWEMVVAAV